MSRFEFPSADGTQVVGWRGGGTGPAVVISNGLGTPPAAWPDLVAAADLRVTSWYYRGTAGGDLPRDKSRITVADHVADCVALMDHEGIERAVFACWSLGVNVAFELALRHPDRVAGVLAVAGVPGGTFHAMFEPLRLPRKMRRALGIASATTARALSPAIGMLARHLPLPATARSLARLHVMSSAAQPAVVLAALEEFRTHDWRWYFTLALAAADHEPLDLAGVRMPVVAVAGRHDLLASPRDMAAAISQLPTAELRVFDGTHFLPLEFPAEMAAELRALIPRCRF